VTLETLIDRMPTMTRKNDLIVWVYLSEIQKQIYSDFLQQPDVKEVIFTLLVNGMVFARFKMKVCNFYWCTIIYVM